SAAGASDGTRAGVPTATSTARRASAARAATPAIHARVTGSAERDGRVHGLLTRLTDCSHVALVLWEAMSHARLRLAVGLAGVLALVLTGVVATSGASVTPRGTIAYTSFRSTALA